LGFIKNIFWNSLDKRFRMVWRLTFQGLILVILLGISELILSIADLLLFDELSFTDPSGAPSGSPPQKLLFSYLVRGLFLSLSVWFAGRFFDRRPFSDFGFRITSDWWKDFWFGIGLGGILITAIFLLELAIGWVQPVGYLVTNTPNLSFFPALLIPLIIYVMVGFYEELFSRGYQLTNLAEGLAGKYIKPETAILLACLLSSAFFGFLHTANPNANLFSTLNICLAGIFLATGFLLTGELAIPIGLHISWNFFQGNVFGFPVSGADFRSATLIQIQQSGPDWITGGAFGPEGGILGIISNLLGILLIIFWVKKRTGHARLHKAISMPPIFHIHKKKMINQPKLQSSDLFLGIDHVIWDWNGTLLDDLDLCLATINGMLNDRGLNTVSRNTYLDIFSFPVIDYYRKLGFDFSEEPFEDISTEFINSYETGRTGCSLMNGSKDLLQLLHASEIRQSILSASKKSYLDQAMIDYNLQEYFVLVDGLDNHHAAGKLSLAQGHLAKLNTPSHSILLIGDTMHDADIAAELGLRCCLIPNGHHSRQRLEMSTATIVGSLIDLKSILLSSPEISINNQKIISL